MARSTKESWLQGPGDLRTEEVHDVPAPGESVLVRGLPARYSAEVMSQSKMVQEGREQVARVDVSAMELLQFQHGCVDPTFNAQEAALIQEKFGPAFKKVIEKIDELSGIDKAAIEQVEQRFPVGGTGEARSDLGVGDAARGDRPDLPVRTGA